MSADPARRTWRIGVAGLGTVGGGLLSFLAERPDFAPAGGRAVVTGVSARSRSRPRPVDISSLAWFDDPVALAQSPDIDIFVELVGGSDGRRRLRLAGAPPPLFPAADRGGGSGAGGRAIRLTSMARGAGRNARH